MRRRRRTDRGTAFTTRRSSYVGHVIELEGPPTPAHILARQTAEYYGDICKDEDLTAEQVIEERREERAHARG